MVKFTFSFLRIFALAHAPMSPEFLNRFDLQYRFWRMIIAKHNIRNSYIHNFHNRSLGEEAIILELFSEFKWFYQNSAGADVWNLHLLQVLVYRQVPNNHGLLILTLKLWRKIKQWHKKSEKCQFCTQMHPKSYIIT